MSVVIETTLGDLTVDLYVRERPATCRNFLALCAAKYYNHCSFHFVQRDFIAQTGDPSGTGSGGESIYAQVQGESGRFIAAESKPKIKHEKSGLLSMVNNGEGLHGSQFFFTLSHSLDYLDGIHTVFGEVVEGDDVLAKLNDTISDEKHIPYQDILITHTVILDDPFPPIQGLVLPPASPEYNFEEILKSSDRIGIGEDIENGDKPAAVIEEELKDKDAKQRALVLEMIGDLPDADMAPPENVLFICKLNPVTREEDLEIIFSRFGRIVSCEIIKDDRSGESLQYGFIEFEKPEDCEQAFFKMDNVLIDDRRIHVDFSQSVSKLKWKGKGRGVTFVNDENEASYQQSDDFGRRSMNYVNSMGKGSRGGRDGRGGGGRSNFDHQRRDYYSNGSQQQHQKSSYSGPNRERDRNDEQNRRRSRSPRDRSDRRDHRSDDQARHRSRHEETSRKDSRKRSRSKERSSGHEDRESRRHREHHQSSSSSSKHSRKEGEGRERDRDRHHHKSSSSSSSKHHRR